MTYRLGRRLSTLATKSEVDGLRLGKAERASEWMFLCLVYLIITFGITTLVISTVVRCISVFALELSVVNVRDPDAVQRGIEKIAGSPNGGLLIAASAPANVHRNLIIKLAAQHRLPAVYPYRYFVAAGGFISYGPDAIDQYHRAAGYVSRILKGEKPADLPVQAPTKYELTINLKTAKALGLTVPLALQVSADEVIE